MRPTADGIIIAVNETILHVARRKSQNYSRNLIYNFSTLLPVRRSGHGARLTIKSMRITRPDVVSRSISLSLSLSPWFFEIKKSKKT